MSKFIIEFLFGVRVKGESISIPTFKTTTPKEQPDFSTWFSSVNFGRRLTNRSIFWS
jgi:hypothetical protein